MLKFLEFHLILPSDKVDFSIVHEFFALIATGTKICTLKSRHQQNHTHLFPWWHSSLFLYQKIFSHYLYLHEYRSAFLNCHEIGSRKTNRHTDRQSDSLLTNSGPYVKRKKKKHTPKHTYIHDTLKSSVGSVETKTGRCLYVTMVLRHRRKILHFNPRTAGGGAHMCPPHRFFADSRKMAARSAAKFGIAVHSSFAHLV